MGETGIDIHPDAVLEHAVGGQGDIARDHAAVGLQRDDDPDIHTPISRVYEFAQQAVVGEVGVFDIDVALCAPNGLPLQGVDFLCAGAGE